MKHCSFNKLHVLIITFLIVLSLPLAVSASDCDHEWNLLETTYEPYSDTDHKVSSRYICAKCGEEREEALYAEHNWDKDAPDDSVLDVVYKSEDYHEVTYTFNCKDCGDKTIERKEEKHKFNKYNLCTKCFTRVPKNITLKAKEKAYINPLSWAKIKVNNKGYLKIYAYGYDNDSSEDWALYNREKLVYADAGYMRSGMCVPVKKGTYYLKVYNDACVKYTFTKKAPTDISKRSKAIKLKKNKKNVTLAYPPAQKNSWIGYYKVKIPKKQFLRLYIGQGSTTPGIGMPESLDINIYNSKGKRIPLEGSFGTEETNWLISSEKLKKGTYYIKLKIYYGSAASRLRYLGSVISLKWK